MGPFSRLVTSHTHNAAIAQPILPAYPRQRLIHNPRYPQPPHNLLQPLSPSLLDPLPPSLPRNTHRLQSFQQQTHLSALPPNPFPVPPRPTHLHRHHKHHQRTLSNLRRHTRLFEHKCSRERERGASDPGIHTFRPAKRRIFPAHSVEVRASVAAKTDTERSSWVYVRGWRLQG